MGMAAAADGFLDEKKTFSARQKGRAGYTPLL